MKIIALSDIHGQHRRLRVPDGLVLVIAGDVNVRTHDEAEDFLSWMGTLPHPRKILVAGNNDRFFDDERESAARLFEKYDVIYLNTAGLTVHGVMFWGSPYTPRFCDMAFNLDPGEDMREHWAVMPANVDVLITHGPPFGILDQDDPAASSPHFGCSELRKRIEAVRPKVSIFGHIHGGFGHIHKDGTDFYNVAVCGDDDRLVNPATEIEIEEKFIDPTFHLKLKRHKMYTTEEQIEYFTDNKEVFIAKMGEAEYQRRLKLLEDYVKVRKKY